MARFHALSFSSIRSSLRRSSNASTSSHESDRNSLTSNTSSSARTIRSIMHRRPSVMDLEEEQKSFASRLEILEPRPLVYWGGLEERMGHL